MKINKLVVGIALVIISAFSLRAQVLTQYTQLPLLPQVNQPITVNFTIQNGNNNSWITWGDGTDDSYIFANTGTFTHTYTAAGNYNIALFNNGLLNFQTITVYLSGNCSVIIPSLDFANIGSTLNVPYTASDSITSLSYSFLGLTGNFPPTANGSENINVPLSTTPGTYPLTVTATTNNSSCSTTQNIFCIPNGETYIDFPTIDTIEAFDDYVRIYYKVFNPIGNVTIDYGNTVTDTNPPPTNFDGFFIYKYTIPGVYTITVSNNGVSASQTVVVDAEVTDTLTFINPTFGDIMPAGGVDTVTVKSPLVNYLSYHVINSSGDILAYDGMVNDDFVSFIQQSNVYTIKFLVNWPAGVNANDLRLVVAVTNNQYAPQDLSIDTSDVFTLNSRTVKGKVFYDLNSNNVQDTLEAGYATPSFTISTGTASQINDAFGNYRLTGFDATNNTIALANPPTGFTVVPAIHAVDLTNPGELVDKNFAMQPTGTGHNLSVEMVRDGYGFYFPSHTYITIGNTGPETSQPCVLTYTYNDADQTIDAINPAANSTTVGEVTFNVPALLPGFPKQYVISGTIVSLPGNQFTETATIDAADIDINDNTKTNESTIVGAYDPNDIAVTPDTLYTVQMANPPFVNYLIRFQNTGNAPAINIRVTDTLATNLDISTFKMLETSHDYQVIVNPNRVVEFLFPNIMLADSTNNEPESHGFITFKIKPYANLTSGTIINAAADIYFDYNPTVRTNTIPLRVLTPLSVDNNLNEQFNFYPNPTRGEFYITQGNYLKNEKIGVTIYAVDGQLVYNEKYVTNGAAHMINTSTLPAGLYYVHIASGLQNTTKKLVLVK